VQRSACAEIKGAESMVAIAMASKWEEEGAQSQRNSYRGA
jgi:hypothetical protein